MFRSSLRRSAEYGKRDALYLDNGATYRGALRQSFTSSSRIGRSW